MMEAGHAPPLDELDLRADQATDERIAEIDDAVLFRSPERHERADIAEFGAFAERTSRIANHIQHALERRYVVRGIAVFAAILCSFVYLVAQIQGVGLIATRFIGVDFAVGIFCGLAGILVCSFLGGMRAVTWTQVAQYIILIFAILIPVSMIAHKDGLGWVPQFSYGRLMARVETLEHQVRDAQLSGRRGSRP